MNVLVDTWILFDFSDHFHFAFRHSVRLSFIFFLLFFSFLSEFQLTAYGINENLIFIINQSDLLIWLPRIYIDREESSAAYDLSRLVLRMMTGCVGLIWI